jgi:anti-sigma factor RsiW
MTRREYTILDIHMALDGEMPAEDREDYEIWFAANPDMKAMSMRFAADRARLQSAFASALEEPVPERLSTMLSDEAAESGSRWSISRLPWRSMAAAALVLVSAAIGYHAGTSRERLPETGDDAVVELALQAHVIYASEKLHVVEVGADQKDHLVDWLSKKVGVPLIAPNFSAEGFQLVGGRLLPAAGNAAAQFMYQDRAGMRISLYVTADAKSSETGFRLYEEDGASSFYWHDGGFYYAIVGGLSERILLDIAKAAYRQLLDETAS